MTTTAVRDSPSSGIWVGLEVLPPALALAYQWAIALVGRDVALVRHAGGSGSAVAWVGLCGSLILVCAVPVAALYVSYVLGTVAQPTRREMRARWIAHLAFTAPSLLVAFGNYARILGAPTIVTDAWTIVWLAAIVAVFAASSDVAPPVDTSFARRWRVSRVHTVCAAGLVIVFLAPHVSNHIAGVWNGAAHIAVMGALRSVYRSSVVEPLLVALLIVQAASGLVLARVRVRDRSIDVFHTLQTTSGVYILVFLFSHLAAAFSARAAGIDTNWTWLVGRAGTLLAYPSLTVVPHYLLGPLALFIHVGCGVRTMRLASAQPRQAANRLAIGIIAAGVVASLAIMVALFGVHLRS